MFVASNYTLVSGISVKDEFEILSFDNALINAKVSDYNILRVSSILPAGCCYQPAISNCKGAVLHMAYASCTKKGVGVISSAVAVGIPDDDYNIGVIMEYSDFEKKEYCINIVENLVKTAMGNRKIYIKEIVSIGCEADLSEDYYATTFAGIAIW